jgi:hypothetical protein
MIANEFRKLQADEEAMASGGSSSSINNTNHRAFQK